MKLLLRKGFQKLLCNFCWYPIRKKKKLLTRSHKDARKFGKCNLQPGKQNAKVKNKSETWKKIPELKNKGRKYSYERWKNKGRKIGKQLRVYATHYLDIIFPEYYYYCNEWSKKNEMVNFLMYFRIIKGHVNRLAQWTFPSFKSIFNFPSSLPLSIVQLI